MKVTLRWVAALAVALAILWYALTSHGPTAGLNDVQKMKSAILAHVPIGTTIDDARKFMEKERFRCSEFTNAIFTMNGGTRKGIDFTYCERKDNAGLLEVRIWDVALVVVDEKVTEILVDESVFGL